jgi:hypothetical protein
MMVNLKLKYENFKRGNENPYTMKTEALRVLEEAKKTGGSSMVDEIEDILMDIQFSINENKCNCNRSSCY